MNAFLYLNPRRRRSPLAARARECVVEDKLKLSVGAKHTIAFFHPSPLTERVRERERESERAGEREGERARESELERKSESKSESERDRQRAVLGTAYSKCSPLSSMPRVDEPLSHPCILGKKLPSSS